MFQEPQNINSLNFKGEKKKKNLMEEVGDLKWNTFRKSWVILHILNSESQSVLNIHYGPTRRKWNMLHLPNIFFSPSHLSRSLVKDLCSSKMFLGNIDLEGNVRKAEMAFQWHSWGLLRIFPTDIFKVAPKVWKDVGNHN